MSAALEPQTAMLIERDLKYTLIIFVIMLPVCMIAYFYKSGVFYPLSIGLLVSLLGVMYLAYENIKAYKGFSFKCRKNKIIYKDIYSESEKTMNLNDINKIEYKTEVLYEGVMVPDRDIYFLFSLKDSSKVIVRCQNRIHELHINMILLKNLPEYNDLINSNHLMGEDNMWEEHRVLLNKKF